MVHQTKIVARFAPSPTGSLHLGGLRTALFNFLFARKHGGKFILRIEDTDKERSKKELEREIIESLAWTGLKFDEFYRQSERTEIYKKHLEVLIAKDLAYISTEEQAGDTKKRNEVIRLRNAGKKIEFEDLIRGNISADTTELRDFVIAKSLTEPLYHFAVVVDDHEMGVSHVIRGEDHIPNTPRQILIGEAIGARRSIYGHLPLILAKDRSKLSKRKGARAVLEYKQTGFLPEGLVNYTALLGWNPGTADEIFSLEELIEKFDIARVQKSGAAYDEEKLRWVNRNHIQKLPRAELKIQINQILKESAVLESKNKARQKLTEKIDKILPIILDRIETFGDLENLLAGGEFDFVFEQSKYDEKHLVWKETGADSQQKTIKHLEAAVTILESARNEINNQEEIGAEKIKNLFWDYATVHGRGEVLWPIRFALTGRSKSADPFTVISVIGFDESIKRLELANDRLKKIKS